LNFYFDQTAFARTVIGRVQKEGDRYGASDEGAGKTVVIDYSSVNIAKRFHIGHLSTTAIGNALYKIYVHLGYTPVGVNHLGDWGTQFGKLIVAYKKWSSREEVEKGGIDVLQRIYVQFHEEAEKDPTLEDQGRAWFKKIEDGDAEALEIFNWFKEVTMRDVERVYKLLGVTFDSYAGESFYHDKTGAVVDELREKGLLVESDGAYIVPLEEEELPPCLILKRDGTTIYATRDLAAVLYRKKTYDFARCLYVVAYQQDLHFKQLFAVVKKMGYDLDLEHVSYGMVSLEDGALSTRKGRVVYLDDLLQRAMEKTYEIICEKSPELENKEDIARQVGVGAVIFSTLSANRIKDIVFSWDRMLNFDGETGPYVQYTYARCCSVLRKAEAGWMDDPDFEALSGREAQDVLHAINDLPGIIREACAKSEPSLITRHAVDIAQAFNKFYYECRILQEEPRRRAARLMLTEAVSQSLKIALGLLGIEAPEKM